MLALGKAGGDYKRLTARGTDKTGGPALFNAVNINRKIDAAAFTRNQIFHVKGDRHISLAVGVKFKRGGRVVERKFIIYNAGSALSFVFAVHLFYSVGRQRTVANIYIHISGIGRRYRRYN